MNTSTAQSPKPQQPKSILLVGPPGSGKSTLALQFPNLVVFDCDMNLDGPERYLRQDRKVDLSYAYDQVTLKEPGVPRPVEECYDHLMSQLKPDKLSAFSWVVIDSLSMVNEFIIRKILKEQCKTEMEARHWQPFKTAALNLLVGRLRHLGKNVIVTAHETAQTRSDPKNIMSETVIAYIPFFQGKVGEMLGAFFTDMLRCTTEAASQGRTEYKLTTTRTSLSDLKNSMGLPSEIVNPTYDKLKPYLNGTH
jgi:hypothetical protein